MPTGNVLLSTEEYVRINMGQNPMILQAHRDAVRIVFNDVKPARGNASFHVLHCNDAPYPIPLVDNNVWALATSDDSSLTITEFNGVNDDNPVDTVGELAMVLMQQLITMTCRQDSIIAELRLMNARIEESFETRINLEDIEHAD